jgi:transcription elongation GreA/GreB family factor
MSKAFTKEDDAGGTEVTSSSPVALPSAPFRLTLRGAERLRAASDARVRGALPFAEIVSELPSEPERAVLGATVEVRTSAGEARHYELVSSEERALTGEGCSLASPLGRALLGARVGDVREVRLPSGPEELEVVAISATRSHGGS